MEAPKLEGLHVEVSQPQLVAYGGKTVGRVDVVGAQLGMPHEEVDALTLGAGDIQDRGGQRLLADERLALLVLHLVELVDRQGALLVAADEQDDARLVDVVLLELARLLEEIDVLGRDGALGVRLRRVGVLAQETLHLGILELAVIGHDDLHGSGEFVQVRERLGREGEAVVAREVDSRGMVARDVVEPAHEREHQDRLEHQVEGPQPARGSEAVGCAHVSCGGASPPR